MGCDTILRINNYQHGRYTVQIPITINDQYSTKVIIKGFKCRVNLIYSDNDQDNNQVQQNQNYFGLSLAALDKLKMMENLGPQNQ